MAKQLISHTGLRYLLLDKGILFVGDDPNRSFAYGDGGYGIDNANKLISKNTVIKFSTPSKPYGTDYIDFYDGTRVRFINSSNNRILTASDILVENLGPTRYIKFRNGDYDYNIYQLSKFDGTGGTMIGGRYKNDITEVLLEERSYSSESSNLFDMFAGMTSLEIFRTTGVNNHTTHVSGLSDGILYNKLKIIDFRAFKSLQLAGSSTSYYNAPALEEFHIGAFNPPLLGPDSFYNSPGLRIFVPNGRAQIYKNDLFWSEHASKIYDSPEF